MRVVKIYCDCCGKQFTDEQKLYSYPIMSAFSYMNEDNPSVDDVEICGDCLYKMTQCFIKNKTAL